MPCVYYGCVGTDNGLCPDAVFRCPVLSRAVWVGIVLVGAVPSCTGMLGSVCLLF